MDQLATQAAPPRDKAVTLFARTALVLAGVGLAMCVIWALGMLSPWLPARIWLWIDFHGLEWWAFAIGTFGPVVAGGGAVLGGLIAFIARINRLRARGALLAVVLGLAGIAVFAAAWVGTSIWVPGA
jgi:hypothetical protein